MSRLACAFVLAAVLAGSASAATIVRHTTTTTFALTLDVGPTEAMYTPADVKAKHPKTGEVMVDGGSMNMGMNMGGTMRHLEVHIATRATGKVVTNVKPTISLVETGNMAMTTKVNAVAMEGVDAGIADFHYGNNVELQTGHAYKVVVTVNGEKATFSFKA